jgi:Holliday junction resolvase RusA-like endonuclease
MNMSNISFTVYGDPVAQGRPRFTTVAGHAKAYDPEKSKSYKEMVRAEALTVRPAIPLDGPLSLTVKVYRSIPKSFSKKKTEAAKRGEIRPITKPDLDNVLKGVKDSLKSVIWRDDSQVVDFDGCGKWYSDVPRVEIIVRAV